MIVALSLARAVNPNSLLSTSNLSVTKRTEVWVNVIRTAAQQMLYIFLQFRFGRL